MNTTSKPSLRVKNSQAFLMSATNSCGSAPLMTGLRVIVSPRSLMGEKPPRDSAALLHDGSGLAEQQLAFFLGSDRRLAVIRIDLLGLGVGAHGGGPLADGLEPALEMREVVDVLALVLVRHDPGIARHVGNGVIAGDELAIGEALVEYAIQPVGLVDIAVDGVLDLFLGVVREVMVLPRHRAQPAHLPESPLDRVVAAKEIGGEKLAGLIGEIQQHRAGLED